jgi:hypothetical protein
MRSQILFGSLLVGFSAFAGCGGSTDEGSNGTGGGGAPGGTGGVAGAGTGATGGYTCFAAGTPIATPRGEIPIEQLRVGDIVLAYDEITHTVVPRPVVRTFVHPDQRPGQLKLDDGRVLRVTDEHPIYLPDRRGYVDAGTLAAETRLLRLQGTSTTSGIADAFVDDPSAPLQTVYNIEVAETHNYFAADVLVHNKSGGAPPCIYEKKPIDGTNACVMDPACLDPVTAASPDAGAIADAGTDGAQELQSWLCSPPDPNTMYKVAFELSSPSPNEDYISLITSPVFPSGTGGGAGCSGFEIGQLWTWHEADAATTDWTTLCTEVPGSILSEHLTLKVEAADAKIRNVRFVESCDCVLSQKTWNSCSKTYEGGAGASSCL